MIKPGLTFLAAYLVLYAVVQLLSQAVYELVIRVTGGESYSWWMAVLPIVRFATALVYQPMFIVLLAVTFHRCLLTLRGKANRAPAVIRIPSAQREVADAG
ncbi:hypothetical protein ACF3NT_12695 [Naumannella halotolerans]|uniref:hypothetical protein n=1 Tax=Naumannella halotolerans TaxID=993414 RepID=UPI00370D6143